MSGCAQALAVTVDAEGIRFEALPQQREKIIREPLLLFYMS